MLWGAEARGAVASRVAIKCAQLWPRLQGGLSLTRVSRCAMQLAVSELPSILPFHSLHYPMDKATLRQISEAYARQTAMKADRSFR